MSIVVRFGSPTESMRVTCMTVQVARIDWTGEQEIAIFAEWLVPVLGVALLGI